MLWRLMRPVSGFLRLSVLERVLVVGILAAVLPLALTAWLSHRQVTERLEQQGAVQLRETGKSYGLGVLERLKTVAARVQSMRGSRGGRDQFDAHGVTSVRIIDPSELAALLAQAGLSEDRSELRVAVGSTPPTYRERRRPLIFTTPGDCCGAVISMGVPVDDKSEGSGEWLLVALDPGYIWGDAEEFPYLTDLCVLNHAGDTLFCKGTISSQVDDAVLSSGRVQGRAGLEWSDADGERHLASVWELFLAGDFISPPWIFVVSQPGAYVTRAADSYKRMFMPVLGLVAFGVLGLAARSLRRSLAPLGQLTEATRRLAGGDLETRVDIATRDEFRELGTAFNSMAAWLGEQFATLRALSQLDRLMLEGSDLEEVAGVVARQMREVVAAEWTAVLIADEYSGQSARLLLDGLHAPPKMGRCSFDPSVWSGSDQPIEIAAGVSELWGELPPALRATGCDHVLVLPVVSEREVRGLLLLGHSSLLPLATRQLDRLTGLADRLALAQSAARRDDALYQQAHFDTLTGLPNRELMMDRLQQHLLHVERESSGGAVLFVDLDRFKQVNDAWGHGAGDKLLHEAGRRIRDVARQCDTVARIGGDEFVVVLSPLEESGDAAALAERLIDRLSRAFIIDGNENFVSASIGITLFPEDGRTVESLLRNADTAMYRAKEEGRGQFRFFSESMNRETVRRVELDRELRRAIDDGGLCLHYQPQFDTVAGRIFGVEALVRWPHPERGLVPAAEFIPIAEDSGLIVPLGAWVMETAWACYREWERIGLHLDCASVNISRRQFRDPRFVKSVLASVERTGVDPSCIELEITETAAAADLDEVAAMLRDLKQVGFRIAIDDFGVGYSSLSQLQHLPFDTVKIDKTFVDGVADPDSGSRALIRAVLTFAEHMGKSVIAEGVETEEQAAILREDGCYRIQGYLYGKPMEAERIAQLADTGITLRGMRALRAVSVAQTS